MKDRRWIGVNSVYCTCGCGRRVDQYEAREMEENNISHTTNVLQDLTNKQEK